MINGLLRGIKIPWKKTRDTRDPYSNYLLQREFISKLTELMTSRYQALDLEKQCLWLDAIQLGLGL